MTEKVNKRYPGIGLQQLSRCCRRRSAAKRGLAQLNFSVQRLTHSLKLFDYDQIFVSIRVHLINVICFVVFLLLYESHEHVQLKNVPPTEMTHFLFNGCEKQYVRRGHYRKMIKRNWNRMKNQLKLLLNAHRIPQSTN